MTRFAFFAEACRVLKPGGRMALSDVLFEKTAAEINPSQFKENYLPNVEAYQDELLRAGSDTCA